MTCLLGAVRGDHVRNWPVPASLVPRPVLSPAARRGVRGQRSEVGGQAFSMLACMACGSQAQYSASRSAGGGKAVSEWLCVRPPLQAHPPASLGWPRRTPSRPLPSLAMGHLPGHTHIWGFSSKQLARRPGSRLSRRRGPSAESLSWAAACGWGCGPWGVTLPAGWPPRPVRKPRDGVAPTPGQPCPGV